MKRLNKEYSLDINNKIFIKYGTVDRNNPQIIYVLGKTWIYPLSVNDYDKIIESIKYNFRKKLKHLVFNNINFDNRFVCDFDINTNSLKLNKKNYLSFELFFKQSGYNNLEDIKCIKDDVISIIKPLIENLEFELNMCEFNLSKSK
jgi:hypothetical protein